MINDKSDQSLDKNGKSKVTELRPVLSIPLTLAAYLLFKNRDILFSSYFNICSSTMTFIPFLPPYLFYPIIFISMSVAVEFLSVSIDMA